MSEVSIRDLRNDGGSVVERVLRGQLVTVTKSGIPVAQLRPVARRPAAADILLQRWSRVPRIDLDQLRAEVDDLLDTRL